MFICIWMYVQNVNEWMNMNENKININGMYIAEKQQHHTQNETKCSNPKPIRCNDTPHYQQQNEQKWLRIHTMISWLCRQPSSCTESLCQPAISFIAVVGGWPAVFRVREGNEKIKLYPNWVHMCVISIKVKWFQTK